MQTRPLHMRPPRRQQLLPAAAAREAQTAAAHRIPDAVPFPLGRPIQSECPPALVAAEAAPEPPQYADVSPPDPPVPHLGLAAPRIGGTQAPARSPRVRLASLVGLAILDS